MRKLLLSIRNFLRYRKPRKISRRTADYVEGIKYDPKLAATELLLRSVGLRVGCPCGLDGVYLTTVQREAMDKAESYGYRVGLG